MSMGERGPKGDHGQIGDTGLTGATGAVGGQGGSGDTGSQGKAGARGATGAPGRSFSRHQVMVIFLFIVAIFLLLGWRSEQQAASLRTAVKAANVQEYRACVQRNGNTERVNNLYQGLIDIERDNPFQQTSPETIARRIALFQLAQQNPEDCGTKP